jgi:hypothetical protein
MTDEQPPEQPPETADLDPDFDDELQDLVSPKRRLVTPVTAVLALAVVAVTAFFGGVELQKSRTSSSSGNAGAGFLRGGGTGTLPAQDTTGPTSGTVATIDGSTLYITDSSGTKIKVTTSAATTFTKVADAKAKDAFPGDSVTVVGERTASGSVTATRVVIGDLAAIGIGGGFGGGGVGGGGGGQLSQALLDCLQQKGVTLPSGGGPGSFADPNVRAALQACRAEVGG